MFVDGWRKRFNNDEDIFDPISLIKKGYFPFRLYAFIHAINARTIP